MRDKGGMHGRRLQIEDANSYFFLPLLSPLPFRICIKLRESLSGMREPVTETAGSVPVRVVVRVVLDQETRGVDLGGFEKGGETVFVLDVTVGDTVVAHHGGSEGENLALVRRICQTFGVTDHASGKDDLWEA